MTIFVILKVSHSSYSFVTFIKDKLSSIPNAQCPNKRLSEVNAVPQKLNKNYALSIFVKFNQLMKNNDGFLLLYVNPVILFLTKRLNGIKVKYVVINFFT